MSAATTSSAQPASSRTPPTGVSAPHRAPARQREREQAPGERDGPGGQTHAGPGLRDLVGSGSAEPLDREQGERPVHQVSRAGLERRQPLRRHPRAQRVRAERAGGHAEQPERGGEDEEDPVHGGQTSSRNPRTIRLNASGCPHVEHVVDAGDVLDPGLRDPVGEDAGDAAHVRRVVVGRQDQRGARRSRRSRSIAVGSQVLGRALVHRQLVQVVHGDRADPCGRPRSSAPSGAQVPSADVLRLLQLAGLDRASIGPKRSSHSRSSSSLPSNPSRPEATGTSAVTPIGHRERGVDRDPAAHRAAHERRALERRRRPSPPRGRGRASRARRRAARPPVASHVVPHTR